MNLYWIAGLAVTVLREKTILGGDMPGKVTGTHRDSLEALFRSTGLANVSSRTIDIRVDYANFDDFWTSQTGLDSNSVHPIRAMSPTDVEGLKDILRERLTADDSGRISYAARSNAVRGVVPG